MTERWLTCEVADGMFSTELFVLVRGPAGKVAGAYVHRSLVRELPDGTSAVRVQVVCEEPGRVTVRLPGEVFGAGAVVAVPAGAVRPPAAAP